MESKLSHWFARAGVAAFLLALLETALVLDRSAYLRGDGAGIACLFICLFALFAFWSAWLALVLTLAEQTKGDWLRFDAPILYSAMAGVGLASYVLVSFRARLDRFGFDQPHIVRELDLWACVVIIAGAAVVARFVAFPILARLARILPIPFASIRVARIIACLVAMMIAVRAASSSFEPLYLTPLAGVAGVFALFTLMIAVRQIFGSPSKRHAQIVIALVLFGLVIAPAGACRQPTAAFALHNAAFVASPLVRLLEISADLDGDGTHSTAFGGTDCDDFDPARGGGITERPGDGIDQDCRGGDAPTLATRTLEVTPFADCAIPDERLSILFITIESLRSDRFAKRRMPNLWGYAEHGIYYRRAYSPATTTAVAFPAIFSGAPASKLGATNLNVELSFHLGNHIAAQLDNSGFDAAAYSALTQPGGNLVGFTGRFPWYRDSVPLPLGTKGLFNSAMVSMNAMNYLRAAETPFFLWIHYADLLAPHLDPQLMANRFRNASNYDLEVAYADFHVGKLLRFLDASPLAAGTAVFVLGTHGEDLGNRGRVGHGRDLFEDSIHVPLIVKIPGCPPRIDSDPVSLVQLAPTIALLAKVTRAGVPLFPATTATAADASRPQLIVSEGLEATYFNRAIVRGRYKLIEDVQSAGRLLFDLDLDPHEETNIYGREPAVVEAIDADFQRWLDARPKDVVARLKP